MPHEHDNWNQYPAKPGSGCLICARFRLSEPEFASGIRRLFMRQPYIVIRPVFGVIFVVAALYLGATTDWTLALPLLAVGVIWLALFAYTLIGIPTRTFRRARRLQEDQVHCFSDDEVTIQLVDGESRLQWSYFRDVIDTGPFYLMRLTARLANIIPKRAFANAADESAFRELVTRRCPGGVKV